MPNAFSKVFVVILLVIMIIFIPVYQSYKAQDDLAYQVAFQAVTNFVDNVRMKGYISPQMVEDFESSLEIGSYLYKTEYVHQKKVYTPVYEDPTNPATFKDEYIVTKDEYFKSQILDYLYKEPNKKPKNDRKYLMTVGDTFNVNVENMTRTKASLLFDYLTGGNRGNGVVISIPYGGMILNEDYVLGDDLE
ncbi:MULTISPECIES: hypothetical protein [unclassified Sporosarcina]|uniref:hypothetical protein n=1 Tax=unclassified Sporosarcina TaxID=2647733 RepID=UPI001A922C7F|nr:MULTISPECIES: hypothetical protein [unclassified Sporosarcina]MBO0589272.1 hypothetical protein [Sporosarcina sp. E16_8]MBO0601979.1 hypothetical protein [Sporosarcina sp. E16_3]